MSGLAPTIPLELQYLIIDAFHADSLASSKFNRPVPISGIQSSDLPLRLVCSSWHDYTSRLFFALLKHVVLRKTDHVVRFCALVRASSRAAALVQSLAAIDRLSVTAGIAELLSEDIEQRLPNLRWVRFKGVQFAAIPREKRMGTWAQLEQVSFDGGLGIETTDGLWDWVAHFAACRSIHFAGSIENTPLLKELVLPPDPPRVHLRSLIFSTRDSVVAAALASPNLRVDKLGLIIYDQSCYTPLLRVLSSKLYELSLMRFHRGGVVVPLNLANDYCTELHTLNLYFLKFSAQVMALVLSDVRAILCASPILSRIQLVLPLMPTADHVTLVAQAWSELDTLLAGTVDRVYIYFNSSPELSLESALKACMPQLTNLSALQFKTRKEQPALFNAWRIGP